ncbi:MAG: monooxygenase, partial [Myxococcota bacterium]|nr:monooxygenase [Myxococcota bacterium]
MNTSTGRLRLLLLTPLWFACGQPSAQVSYHQDIRQVLDENCIGCHSADGVGGFPLTDYDTVYALRDVVADAVIEGRMPPWSASQDCAPYQYDLTLDADTIDLIADWVDQGAPEGDETDSITAPLFALPELDRVDMQLELPEAYTPENSPDDYRCFVIEWPEQEETYVTGYRVNPGVDAMVHHVIAYLADAEYSDAFMEMEASEDSPGYTCYGGPGVIDQESAQWLGGWAPGGGDTVFPEGTGVRVDPGSLIILQVHYNTASMDPEPDLTTVDLVLED